MSTKEVVLTSCCNQPITRKSRRIGTLWFCGRSCWMIKCGRMWDEAAFESAVDADDLPTRQEPVQKKEITK